MVMDLNHQIRTLRHRPRKLVGLGQRNSAWNPSANERRPWNFRPAEARIPPVRGCESARRAVHIEKDQSVVHHTSVLRTKFQSADKNVEIELEWNDEALELIRTIGRQ